MKLKRRLTIGVVALGAIGTTAMLSRGQAPAPAPALRTGPGVQAAADAREPEVLATCKTQPPARGGAARGGGGRAAFNPANGHRDYTVTEIPGVIAAGTKWKEELWQDSGNNIADGIIATKDGGVMFAQNDKSDVVKLDKDGKPSIIYADTNTGGALSMNSKGVLFVVSRGLREAIVELAPQRRTLADKYQGDPLDCIGGTLNDLTADSKGGVYFTIGPPASERNGLFYADPKGVVTKFGVNLATNGLALSPDEKTLYVTNGLTLAAFDVQKDGSLTNQRVFANLQPGGAVTGNGDPSDGCAVDATGRIYVITGPGIQVWEPDGKYLGLIPTPRPTNSLTFSGPDKKTLFVVAQVRDGDPTHNASQIISIQMIARGYKGRAK